MPARPALSPLFRELIKANQRARDPRLQDALSACRFTTDGAVPAPQWGIGYVEISRLTYEPNLESGQPALIVGAWDRAERALLDLVACRLLDRRVATRRGNARAIGEEWVDRAIEHEMALPLFADPINWLAAGTIGTVIVDWSQAGFILDGVADVICRSRSLAARVHATTRRMHQPPRIHFVQRSLLHAA
jgi:hypothetical protein